MLSLFTPQATCTANRFGAALTSTPGSRSHDKVIEDGRKVLSLTGPPREPIGPGGPAGPVSPCKEQGWSQGVCLGPLRQPPLGLYCTNPIRRILYLVSRWAGRTRRTDGTYVALNNWKIRKLYLLYQNMTMLTPLFCSLVFMLQCRLPKVLR